MEKKELLLRENEYYSMAQLVTLGVLDTNHYAKASAEIWRDKATKNVLDAIVTGEGAATRFRVQGKNAMQYMVNRNDGEL